MGGKSKKKSARVSHKAKSNSTKRKTATKLKKSKEAEEDIKNHPLHKQAIHGFKSLPLGMRTLLQFNGLLAICYLMLILFSSSGVLFGIVINGFASKLIHLFFFIALLYVILGISFRKEFAYYMMMILYSFAIFNSVLSLLFISNITDSALRSIHDLFFPVIIAVIIVNGLCLWYMFHKHKYFTAKDKTKIFKQTKFDNIFVKLIYVVYFIGALVILISVVLVSINTIGSLDSVLDEIQGKDVSTSLGYCDSLELNSKERDLCYLSTAVIHKEEQELVLVCPWINDNFYRFTCFNQFDT